MLALLPCLVAVRLSAFVSPTPPDFWTSGRGLAVSFVFGLEAGGQPVYNATPPTHRMDDMAHYLAQRQLPDYPTRTWYEYGIHEGVPRLLRLFDSFGIKVSCLVSTAAALNSPVLAKEIVKRGHEAVCHGMHWETLMDNREDEKQFLVQRINLTQQITGQRCTGYNALWMGHTPHTNSLLQELGFTYYVDDVSRDIPFTKLVDGRPMVIVPYSLRNHDMLLRDRGFSADNLYNQLVYEFEELYLEAQTQRRMMTVPIHDNIGGIPATVHAYRKFLTYISAKPDIWFVRKDWLSEWTMANGPHYSCNSTDFICQASTCTGNCPDPNW
eukprot:Hpha_TRINITY_DN30903_c0_g1::TRINITY_DN30903_c0_g1_i1::g.112207::m.112207